MDKRGALHWRAPGLPAAGFPTSSRGHGGGTGGFSEQRLTYVTTSQADINRQTSLSARSGHSHLSLVRRLAFTHSLLREKSTFKKSPLSSDQSCGFHTFTRLCDPSIHQFRNIPSLLRNPLPIDSHFPFPPPLYATSCLCEFVWVTHQAFVSAFFHLA